MIKVLNNIRYYSKCIRDMLLYNKFEPSEYVYELRVERGKERKLQKPKFFPDQIIHHALIMLIRDKLVKRLDYYACASIPGRGQNRIYHAIKSWAQHNVNNTTYCLKCDIKKCFENVKPDMIVCEFRKIIKDERWLAIFSKVIYSTESLPLGNYMSAWILNVILKQLDYKIRDNSHISHYARYMDDFCVLSASSIDLHRLAMMITQELAKLGLELKHNFQVYNVTAQGVDIIGYRFFRNRVLMRKANLKSLYKSCRRTRNSGYRDITGCRSVLTHVGNFKYFKSDKVAKIVKGLVRKEQAYTAVSAKSREVSRSLELCI